MRLGLHHNQTWQTLRRSIQALWMSKYSCLKSVSTDLRTLRAELQSGACSLRLCAEIIQSWGIIAHWEKNRRTEIPPCAHMWPFKPVRNQTLFFLNFKRTWTDLSSNKFDLPLILVFSWFSTLVIRTRLHVVHVGDRLEENNVEPGWADSLNIKFVPAADS